jgi:ribosomal protein L7/L12
LPEAVRQALQRGSLFDAIKLLRKAGVSNLAEAKAVLEAEARRLNAAKGMGTAAAPRSSTPAGLPPGAQRALRDGLKIEAIKLTREHTGLGLKEAKDLVEAYERTMPATPDGLSPESGLSPGEVPRSSGRFWWIVFILAVAAGLVWRFWFHDPG